MPYAQPTASSSSATTLRTALNGRTWTSSSLPIRQAAANEAASWVARQLRNAVSRRGVATVAFSGGSTPALMLAALTELPVPWDATTVFQVDERVAPDGDPDRNATLLDVLRPLRCRRSS